MSTNGLIGRVASGDAKKENENIISICMGSTSANIEGKNNDMLKKFPIIAINGCSGKCVNKILKSKEINVYRSIAIFEILEKENISPEDPFRLGKNGEKCVSLVKKEIQNLVKNYVK